MGALKVLNPAEPMGGSMNAGFTIGIILVDWLVVKFSVISGSLLWTLWRCGLLGHGPWLTMRLIA